MLHNYNKIIKSTQFCASIDNPRDTLNLNLGVVTLREGGVEGSRGRERRSGKSERGKGRSRGGNKRTTGGEGKRREWEKQEKEERPEKGGEKGRGGLDSTWRIWTVN